MTSKMNLTFVDYSGETSNVGVRFADLTAVTFTATNDLMDDLQAAIAGVSTGNLQKDSRIAAETRFSVSNPSNVWAQREIKWLVRCVDANGNAVTFEIPCADLTLLAPGTDKLDATSTEGAALVAAINAGARSNDGEVITFVEAVAVGRTL